MEAQKSLMGRPRTASILCFGGFRGGTQISENLKFPKKNCFCEFFILKFPSFFFRIFPRFKTYLILKFC